VKGFLRATTFYKKSKLGKGIFFEDLLIDKMFAS
jgi:hypothetical protein